MIIHFVSCEKLVFFISLLDIVEGDVEKFSA